ncbi:MAG: calcium-binding protein [Sphingomonas bacterium]|uniref:EF-hand domain-containing protein n=1 Tax=Sphingomonas bacterium TaxID=1895847 RepID=UPI0026131EEB|nr:EF-hand domain-containing protein [Sphingomonas bacterium]MDB5711115.1 calcium-binding protein [Sphingomonas bacterium]
MYRYFPIALTLLAALPATAQNVSQRQPIALPAGSGPPPTATQPTMVVEPVAMMIAACDADGDGRVTRAELTPCVARSFAAIDTDHAGSIGYIGYGDWALKWLGDSNALPSPFSVDADNDNRITLAELQEALARAFDRLDKDHDGVLTRAELLTIRASTGGGQDGRGKRGR